MIGLITARSGSKGVPGKNIRDIAGVPLIAWTIQAALASRLLDRVIVSTDCPRIAKISQAWGAEVPFLRPAALSGDHSPHVDVVLHFLDWLAAQGQPEPRYLVLLQPTSPLRTAENIDGAISLASARDADAVVSVVESHLHPELTCWQHADCRMSRVLPENGFGGNRQELRPAYFVNGAIYVNRPSSLRATRSFYPEPFFGYVMDQESSQQIDTPVDWHLTELLLKSRLQPALRVVPYPDRRASA